MNLKVSSIPSVGELLKEGRQKQDLTQKELEKLTEVPLAEISRIERGVTKRPRQDVLKAIAPYTGVSFSKLLFIAGYSTEDKEQYYNKSKELINCSKILEDIYKASPDLLETLYDIDKLPYDDIQLLTNYITTSKEYIRLINKNEYPAVSKELLGTTFQSIKKILIEQLNSFNELVKAIFKISEIDIAFEQKIW